VIQRSTRSSRSSGTYSVSIISIKTVLISHSVLGTPTENDWPGVTSFPDFKSSFPKWARTDIATIVTTLDNDGLELLDSLLVYDPAGRISAKQAVHHAYFTESTNGYYNNGYH
jgi:cyclin-dependent kinase